jgi:hypothetical protein
MRRESVQTDCEMRFDPLVRSRDSPTESLPSCGCGIKHIASRDLEHLLLGRCLRRIVYSGEVDVAAGTVPPPNNLLGIDLNMA